MDHDQELDALAAETVAIQNVLAHVLYRISQLDDRFHGAIKQGFDDAASGVEDLAIRFGKAASPDHLVKAIRVVEELRTATLGDPDKPRRGV
jgi:hypothetical protein